MKQSSYKRYLIPLLTIGGAAAINNSISRSSMKGLLKTSYGKKYPWKLGDVFFTKTGAGKEPLLLLHDIAEYSSSYEWIFLLPYLKEQYTVYSLDLPGCGRSCKPSVEYTNYLYVQLISSFINDVIRKDFPENVRPYVCTSGRAGSAAVMASHQDPQLFRGIAMINPLSPVRLQKPLNPYAKALRFLMNVPVFGTLLYYTETSKNKLEYLLKEKGFYNPFLVQKNTIDAFYEAAHMDYGKGKNLFASLKCGYLNWNIQKAVSGLSVPAFILQGSALANKDSILKAYRKLKSGIVSRIIPETNYFPQLENASAVADLLITSFSNL